MKKNKNPSNTDLHLAINLLKHRNSSEGCDTIENFDNITSFWSFLALIEISLIINSSIIIENNVTEKQLELKFEDLCLGTFIDEYTIVSSRLCVRIDEEKAGIMDQLNKLPKFMKEFEYDLDKSKYFYTSYFGMSKGGENHAGSILRAVPFKSISIVSFDYNFTGTTKKNFICK